MNGRLLLRRAVGEPTVHFAAAGLLLFGGAAVSSSRSNTIHIPREAIEARVKEVERGRGTRLTPEERTLAEQAYIDEHVLARAARARGLDDDDRIRGILYQKMLQILSSDVLQPDEEELAAYYGRHRVRYARPATLTAEQWAVAGGRTVQQATLQEVTRSDVTLAFGAEAAAAAFSAEVGDWIGPFPYEDGYRSLRIVERRAPGEPPPFSDVRDQVRFDWIAEREAVLLKERVSELRAEYRVEVIDGGETR